MLTPAGPRTRTFSTTRTGDQFNEYSKQLVWNSASPLAGRDAARWRLDACGALMDYTKYGDTAPRGFGWEIDHVVPISRGGTDLWANLQPLQWENNRKKSDGVYASADQYRAVYWAG